MAIRKLTLPGRIKNIFKRPRKPIVSLPKPDDPPICGNDPTVPVLPGDPPPHDPDDPPTCGNDPKIPVLPGDPPRPKVPRDPRLGSKVKVKK